MGELKGLFSGLSLVFLAFFLGTIAIGVGVRLFVAGEVINVIAAASANTDVVSLASQLEFSQGINFPGLFLLLAITIFFLFISFSTFFRTVRKYLGASRFLSGIVSIAVLALSSLLFF